MPSGRAAFAKGAEWSNGANSSIVFMETGLSPTSGEVPPFSPARITDRLTLGTAIARWPEHQDTSGCSRPGMSCAVHAYAGQKGDAPQASALIEGLPAEVVIADTAYDGNHLRQAIAAKGALTRHARSNIRSTSTAMPSAISSNAASPSSSNFVASQPLRKDRPKLLCRHYSRSHHLMDAISVHTT